jgi:hypothetical protein
MTSFRISGLPIAPFAHLFGLDDDALAARGAKRYVVDQKPGFPDRIEMRDLEPGERALLLNYVHQDAETPYRASHAIFVGESARETYTAVNTVPEVMRRRAIGLRAFDAAGMMLDADITDGTELEALIEHLFANPETAYIHAHYAKRGCFAARIDRA